MSTSPPVFTDIGEGSVLDASEGLLQGVGEPRQLHGLPQLGVLVTDRVVPHRQLGPLHRVQCVVQTHVLPDAANRGALQCKCYIRFFLHIYFNNLTRFLHVFGRVTHNKLVG